MTAMGPVQTDPTLLPLISFWLPNMTQPQSIQGKPSTAFWAGNLASLAHWWFFCMSAELLTCEVRCAPALGRGISTLLGTAGDYCVLTNFVLLFFLIPPPTLLSEEIWTEIRKPPISPTLKSHLQTSKSRLTVTNAVFRKGGCLAKYTGSFYNLTTWWMYFHITILSSGTLFPAFCIIIPLNEHCKCI